MVDAQVDPRVQGLLVGQVDSSPIEGSGVVGAAVRGGHDAGPPPVMIAKPDSPSRRAASRASVVHGVARRRAGGPEDRDRLADVGERGKAGGELVVDALDAQRVVEVGLDVERLGLEQLLVERLGPPAIVVGVVIHLNRVGTGGWSLGA